jgi:hypothetical protein
MSGRFAKALAQPQRSSSASASWEGVSHGYMHCFPSKSASSAAPVVAKTQAAAARLGCTIFFFPLLGV